MAPRVQEGSASSSGAAQLPEDTHLPEGARSSSSRDRLPEGQASMPGSSSVTRLPEGQANMQGGFNFWPWLENQTPQTMCAVCSKVSALCLLCWSCEKCCLHRSVYNRNQGIEVRRAYVNAPVQTDQGVFLPASSLPDRAMAVGTYLLWEAGVPTQEGRLSGRARRRYDAMVGAHLLRRQRGDVSSEDEETPSSERTTASDREEIE